MNYLYLLLDLGSLSVPFLFSFHPKLRFYTHWKSLFLAIVLTMCIFIPWDVIFTNNDIWGFNFSYLSGPKILNLPIEEWLFFITVPYACVFTHYALLHYFPTTKIKAKSTQQIGFILITVFFLTAFFNYGKWYTLVNFLYAAILLSFILKNNMKLLQTFFLTFLVMLIPFFLVNGILTGSFIDNQVVWYNDHENLGIRLFTIPIEDTIYAFSLILTNLYLMTFFKT